MDNREKQSYQHLNKHCGNAWPEPLAEWLLLPLAHPVLVLLLALLMPLARVQ